MSAISDQKSFDAVAFRNALGSFTTGVTVVTTHCQTSGDVGLTANSFNSVSLSPPMVLWSLAKSAFSVDAFKAAEFFAVHILSEDQQSLSNQFARKGADKFSGLTLGRGPGEVPLLEDCSARFLCKTAYQYEGGDHIIFVGEVLDFSHHQKLPLLFFGGQYSQIQKPDADLTAPLTDDSLGYLLRLSYQKLMLPLAAELQLRDISMHQHYFLANVSRNSNKTMTELMAAMSEVNGAPPKEDIEALFDKGLITMSGDLVALTREGIGLRIELAAVYKSLESEALKSLSYDKAQSLKLLLKQFINTVAA